MKNQDRSRRPRKAPRQAPSFDIGKAGVLGKLDKSPKGSLDAPIADTVHIINAHADFVTTSSCSGRIALFAAASGPGRGGHWLLASHGTVTAEELSEALHLRAEGGGAVVEEVVAKGAAVAEGAAAVVEGAAPSGVPSSSSVAGSEGLVTFKLEPGIMHVMCRDVGAAKWLLQVALAAGFRESGIVLSSSAKTMLAIRSTANSLELPVAEARGPPACCCCSFSEHLPCCILPHSAGRARVGAARLSYFPQLVCEFQVRGERAGA
jgi:tRNA wybutosine-synthesizing protein 3